MRNEWMEQDAEGACRTLMVNKDVYINLRK